MLDDFPAPPPKSKHHDILLEISKHCVAFRDTRQTMVPWAVWDKIVLALLNTPVPEEKEMARLREIEHAAWHAIEACEERGDHLIIPLDEAVVLTKLLPEAHPGNDEAAPSPQKGRT